MWGVIRRLLAVIGLTISLTALALFITAIVEVWKLKAETNRRANELAGRAHSALHVADRAVTFVREVIDQGKKDLEDTRNKAVPANDEKTPVNPLTRLAARQASEKLAGSVERADTAVITASDATVVAETALKLFGEEEEWKDWFGVKPEQLAQTRSHLGTASSELKKVRTLLGIPVNSPPTAEQLVTVESALDQARKFTDQMNTVVSNARQRVDDTKRAVDLWTLRVALGVTLAGVVGGLGQFFMARFCWRVLRGQPA